LGKVYLANVTTRFNANSTGLTSYTCLTIYRRAVGWQAPTGTYFWPNVAC